VQNPHQRYPTMRDQDGRLAGWGLPHDHFETDISNFLKSRPEEVAEVNYPESYQAMFGGTPGSGIFLLQSREYGFRKGQDQSSSCPYGHTYREKGSRSTSETSSANIRDACADCSTAQSLSTQPVLTLANTIAHTRSSPQ
jgi:hypothetical protein